MTVPSNDDTAALTRFCLAVEEHRRTPEGRVRTPQQFSSWFFTPSETVPEDKLFRHLPQEVRGPIVSAWGIRGSKAAVRDSDEKVATVVSDAIIAGDLSPGDFEEGFSPGVLISWVPLSDWWAFWRGGALTKPATHKALAVAYELGLFDAAWMFDHLEAKGGAQRGTVVVSEGLSKDDLVLWVRKVHESRDGTPKGLLDAMGWDKLVEKTPNEALFGLLDALAKKVGLLASQPAATKVDRPPTTEALGAVAPPSPAAPEATGTTPSPTRTSSPPPRRTGPPPLPDLSEGGGYGLQVNNGQRSTNTKEPETTRKLQTAPPAQLPDDAEDPDMEKTRRFVDAKPRTTR